MMNDDMNVAKADAQQTAEHLLRDGQQFLRVDMDGAIAFRRLDRVARSPVIERRQNDEVHLLFEHFEDFHNGQRIHADGHVLAMIFQHAERQRDRPALRDRSPDLMRQHQFVAQLAYPALANSASTSARFGIDGAVPAFVTERPATAQPKRAASIGAAPSASAAANPPLKASPAPVVSTTGPARKAGIRIE